MTGVIWFVQVVHYPLFSEVNQSSFTRYAEAHQRLTTWVVGPPMLLEAVTAGLLLWWWWWQRREPLEGKNATLLGISGGLLLIVWLSTALLQVPGHDRLGSGFTGEAHRSLVVSNWVRTVAWSARSALVLWLTARMMR